MEGKINGHSRIYGMELEVISAAVIFYSVKMDLI